MTTNWPKDENPLRPLFLEGYPVFLRLNQWRQAGKPKEDRQWSLKSFQRCNFTCRLSWVGEGALLHIVEHADTSAEQAVYMALEQFTEWQQRDTLKKMEGRQ